MLHAFDAATGRERWAFIPAGVLPKLWRVGDKALRKNFQYLLDGTPVVGDICPVAPSKTCTAEEWRTILVAGLGAAGREFYALDITQADQPKLLWRINADTEAQLGYAVGKPIITKRRDGTWTVLIASGYNNMTPGSGHGVLFVLNATTGAVLKRIDTGAGTTNNPAGLAQLNAWVEGLLDNTAERVYGGDLLGNVWRFDINDTSGTSGNDAVLLARLLRNGGVQPITTRLELSLVRVGNQSLPVVSVGTGRYLGSSDVGDKSIQSIYTFRDYLSDSGLGDLRQRSSMVKKHMIPGDVEGKRGISDESVDWLVNDGWYVDLDAQPDSGERVVLDPEQQLGMLSVMTNVPDSNACRPRAESWSYAFNYINGNYLPIAKHTWVGRRVSSASMVAGARMVRVGRQVVSILTDDGGTVSAVVQPADVGGVPNVRRVAWRELEQQ
jgi:type IV pilus assembly protein PilY1